MWWAILPGLLFLFLFWLLWAPLRLEIDSEHGIFRFRWQGIFALQWLPEAGLDCFRARIFFVRRDIQLSRFSAKPVAVKKTEPARPARRKPATLPAKKVWQLAHRLLATFTIKRCRIDWDSDDFIWNAQVYPLAQALNTWGKPKVYINFMGRRELALEVENRLGRMVWVLLKTFIFKR